MGDVDPVGTNDQWRQFFEQQGDFAAAWVDENAAVDVNPAVVAAGAAAAAAASAGDDLSDGGWGSDSEALGYMGGYRTPPASPPDPLQPPIGPGDIIPPADASPRRGCASTNAVGPPRNVLLDPQRPVEGAFRRRRVPQRRTRVLVTIDPHLTARDMGTARLVRARLEELFHVVLFRARYLLPLIILHQHRGQPAGHVIRVRIEEPTVEISERRCAAHIHFILDITHEGGYHNGAYVYSAVNLRRTLQAFYYAFNGFLPGNVPVPQHLRRQQVYRNVGQWWEFRNVPVGLGVAPRQWFVAFRLQNTADENYDEKDVGGAGVYQYPEECPAESLRARAARGDQRPFFRYTRDGHIVRRTRRELAVRNLLNVRQRRGT